MQAEAKERKEGSLREVQLLQMELDELRSSDFETKYEDAKEQVRHLDHHGHLCYIAVSVCSNRCFVRMYDCKLRGSRGVVCTASCVGGEGSAVQVQKLEKEIQSRNEKFKIVEQQMQELRDELAKKGEDLDAAKSELSELKQQVKEQLTELQISRAPLPFPKTLHLYMLFPYLYADLASDHVTEAVHLQARS